MVNVPEEKKIFRCAIYTRKSTEAEQEYNSLDAQREAAENFIASQKLNGWQLLPEHYDDGGFSGSNTERPALKRLLVDVEAGKIVVLVIYKLDRLSRSLLDFMKLIEFFEKHGTSIVSITQQINTSTSAGRMLINILMTFAQYEREVIAERVRDKIAGAKRRGKFCGGTPVLGYDSDPKTKKLVVNEPEAELVRKIFRLYSRLGSGPDVVRELNRQGEQTKSYVTRKGRVREGRKFRIDHVWRILNNPLYIGQVHHKGKTFPGEHKAIINERDWELVHTMLKSNTTAKRKSKFDTAYPLKGLIRCGYCDSGMTTTYTKNGNRRYIYLNCVKSRKNPEHCCPLGQIPGREFEKTVLQQLGALFRTPSILAKTYQAATENAAEERELLLKKRDELTCRSEKLLQEMSQLVDEGSNEDLVLRNKQKQKVDRELKKIKKHLQILSSETLMQTEIVEAFNRVEELWDELFPGEKHRLCRLFIENIVLFRDNMEIEIKTNALNSLVSELTSSILKGSKYGSTDLHSPPE